MARAARWARNGIIVRDDPSLLSDQDLYLFNEGTHLRLWEKLGAHPVDGGTYFAVWAPNAERVSVIGEFNDWDPERHPLRSRDRSGVWEGVVPGVSRGARYKYRVTSRYGGYRVDKADPLGLYHESPPQTASRVWSLEYAWGDGTWMADRGARDALRSRVRLPSLLLRLPGRKRRPGDLSGLGIVRHRRDRFHARQAAAADGTSVHGSLRATRSWLLRPPRATGRLGWCSSSTRCTSTASASSSTGSVTSTDAHGLG
jgi:hypothetical protein